MTGGELCFTYKQQISGKLYKFMVMNSMEKELVPPYDINEWAREIDIGNGYLTGIYVSVRPADCP